LLEVLEVEGGGFNFVGNTSEGKTTALMVAGSVIGGGSSRGFLRTWRATDNAIEVIAALHNDNLLLLDEFRELPDPRQADQIAYMLANGSGKGRSNPAIALRHTFQWKLLFLSSGEIRLSEQVALAGRKTKGGAEVRLLNIPANAGKGMGTFENLHGVPSAAAFADQLVAAAKQHYGCAFRAFLTELVVHRDQYVKQAQEKMQDFIETFKPQNAAPEVGRALRRFALVCAAGEVATTMGITGWSTGDAWWASGHCFEAWLSDRGGAGAFDTEAAIAQVRNFVEANGAARFQSLSPKIDPKTKAEIIEKIPNRARFWRKNAKGERQYLIFPETFQREVCVGHHYVDVARALKERGWLLRNPPHWTLKVRNAPEGKRFFCVRAAILDS
jgi:uncharacterized protein (DUF927 family)